MGAAFVDRRDFAPAFPRPWENSSGAPPVPPARIVAARWTAAVYSTLLHAAARLSLSLCQSSSFVLPVRRATGAPSHSRRSTIQIAPTASQTPGAARSDIRDADTPRQYLESCPRRDSTAFRRYARRRQVTAKISPPCGANRAPFNARAAHLSISFRFSVETAQVSGVACEQARVLSGRKQGQPDLRAAVQDQTHSVTSLAVVGMIGKLLFR